MKSLSSFLMPQTDRRSARCHLKLQLLQGVQPLFTLSLKLSITRGFTKSCVTFSKLLNVSEPQLLLCSSEPIPGEVCLPLHFTPEQMVQSLLPPPRSALQG